MSSWGMPGLLSKVLVSLVLVLVILQYMFGSIVEINKHWDTLFYSNTTRGPPVYTNNLKHKHHGGTFDSTNSTVNGTISVIPSTVIASYDTNNTTVSYGNISLENNSMILPPCPLVPPNLIGEVEIKKSPVPTVQELENRFTWLKPGGHYGPPNCQTKNRVGIIVPYRARAEHLLLFLQHMHPFLKVQQIEYTIFIVEQNGNGPFNRAMLMNVGFKEALNMNKFDCFIFHDVDLLPENDKNLYTCPEQPRHMSVAVDVFKYKLPYNTLFGGVSALTKEQFQSVNGFSNSFWGWGGEDDDMSNRIKYHKYHISRYPINLARYTMLTHQKEKANPKRYENLQQGKKKYKTDGLINLKYTIVESRTNLLYTWFLVNLYKPS